MVRARPTLRPQPSVPSRLLYCVCFMLFVPNSLQAQNTIDPALAVVRIPSHGASGAVIWSAKGKSYILSCAHMFHSPDSRTKPLRIDGPVQPLAPRILVKPKVIGVDYARDLSLIELPNGPFYNVQVAPPGFQVPAKLLSIGYDNMKWPVTRLPVTFLSTGPTVTYTRERPWHGRSGGALVDPKTNYLVGVVQGYEVTGPRRGLYASHAAILQFLKKHAHRMTPRFEQPSHFQKRPLRSYRPAVPGNLFCLPGGT